MTRKASPLDSIRLSNALDALLRTTVTGMTKGVEGRRPVRVCGDRIAPPFVRKKLGAVLAKDVFVSNSPMSLIG